MHKPPPRELRPAVKALRASLFTLITCVDELCDLIEAAPASPALSTVVQVHPSHPAFRLDHATYTLHWRERACELGNTFAFQLLERLGRKPNEYVSTERLLDEVWLGSRSSSTVRSTVCRLRCRLRHADMADLAESIDGRASGHYRIVLPTI